MSTRTFSINLPENSRRYRASISAKDPSLNDLMTRTNQYSPAGNVQDKITEHGTYSYLYDGVDRLTAAVNPTRDDEAFTYDNLGNRLSSADVAETVLKQSDEAYEKRTRARAKGVGLDMLIGLVSNRFEISKAIIQSASKHRETSRVRSMVCYLAVDRLEQTVAEVARYLTLTPSAVSKLVYRGRMDENTEAIERELLE